MRIDLHALAEADGVDLFAALRALAAIYREIDERNARNTASLNLPCKRGCSACCEESVLLTQLEFYAVWDQVQRSVDDETLERIVKDGLALYDEHRAVIEQLEAKRDHTAILRDVRFRCPILDDSGACRAYESREIKSRLFGCSFNDDGGVYGCNLVGAHLGNQLVTLVKARPAASKVHALPLTDKQQLYPFYIHELYGSGEAD